MIPKINYWQSPEDEMKIPDSKPKLRLVEGITATSIKGQRPETNGLNTGFSGEKGRISALNGIETENWAEI